MAKARGIVTIQGSIGDVTFTDGIDGQRVKEKGGVIRLFSTKQGLLIHRF